MSDSIAGVLSTFLVAHAALVPLAALALLGALVLTGIVLQRRRSVRIAGALAGLAVAAALVLTLTPDAAAPTTSCRVGFTWPTVRGVEAFANLLLLLPAALLGTIATRRPLATAAAGAGLSAAVETVQAIAPSLGRACDTQDWELNTIGALVGAVLGWWIGRPVPARQRRARTVIGAVAAAAVIAWLVVPALVPSARVADPCSGPPAGAAARLQGGVRVTAGRDGGLCIVSPSGTSSLVGDLTPGPQSSDGGWEVGVEAAGTRSATDSAGRRVRLVPVAGSDLLVWSAPTS